MCLIFHVDLFIEPVDRFQYQSWPLTDVALKAFESGDCASFRNVIPHNYPVKLPELHAIVFIIQRGTSW